MISIIAAIGKNNELGKNNDLIWDLPNDLKFFKKTTIGHPVVMGYNTYLSIGRPLSNRENIVLSDKPLEDDGLTVYNDINKLTSDISNDDGECFIIGGASLYNYYYPLADKMYLTLIDAEDKEADVYFPKINYDDWETETIDYNKENNINYNHVVFTRKRTK